MKRRSIRWIVSAFIFLLEVGVCSSGPNIWAATVETWSEGFESDPLTRGWKSAGASELFHWDATTGTMVATWDSSRSNSYFYRELPRALTIEDDFSASWDLLASHVEAGVDPDKPGTFQMAVGFIHLEDALGRDFVRGSGTGSPNLLEWTYFPDTGFGETFSSAVVASNGVFQSAMQFPFPLRVGEWHHVELKYEAALRRVSLVVTSASLGKLVVGPLILQNRFPGFVLDAFSISSYSDEGQDPDYGGSIFAQAQLDHIELKYPVPEALRISGLSRVGDHWRVKFNATAGRKYALMRSVDLHTWLEVAQVTAGETGELELEDPGTADSLKAKAFFRIESGLP